MENPRKYLQKMEHPHPHLGEMVKKVIQERRIPQSEVARKIGVGQSTVAHYLRQPSLQFGILWKLCIALNYDFLAEFQRLYPATMPSNEQQKIKELEKEIAIYKAALRISDKG